MWILMESKKTFLIFLSFFLLFAMIACSMPAITQIDNSVDEDIDYRSISQVKSSVTPTIQQTTATPVKEIANSEMVDYKPIHDADFLLSYDPDVWYEIGDFMGVGIMLEHKTLEGCFIVDPRINGHGMAPFADPALHYFNGRNWMSSYADMYTYLGDERLYLELGNFEMHANPECREAQEAVLKTLHIDGELTVRETQIPTYTPVPEFICPNTPKVIHRIGYCTGTLTYVRLRSTPETRDDNIIAHINPHTEISISDGPVCGPYDGGAYVYFYVTIHSGNYAGYKGWMAEGDFQQYFMGNYIGGG